MRKRNCVGILFVSLVFLLSACGSAKTEKVTELGYPTQYSKKREEVFQIDLSGDGIKLTTSHGKLVEAIDTSDALFTYYGKMKGSKPHGYGLVYGYGKLLFGGEFKGGKPDGYGIVFDADDYNEHPYVYEADDCSLLSIGGLQRFRASGTGFVYEYGSFTSDEPHILYSGELDKNERDGNGVEYYIGEAGFGQLRYKGKFKNDKFHGEGKLYNEDGSLLYDGELRRGLYDGSGKLYSEDGSVRYKGKFKNGEIKA